MQLLCILNTRGITWQDLKSRVFFVSQEQCQGVVNTAGAVEERKEQVIGVEVYLSYCKFTRELDR